MRGASGGGGWSPDALARHYTRFRVRERTVLRYYARTIEHLLVTTGRTH